MAKREAPWKQILTSAALLTAAACLAVSLTGCGKEEFVNQNYTSGVSASGYETLPAKVDLLFVMDNTGSFTFPYGELSAALPTFVNTLTSQGWNYHMASIPMAQGSSGSYTAPSINSVLVNSSANTPTLRGGAANPDYVVPANALTNPYALQMIYSINSAIGSNEQTLRGIRDALSGQRVNFVRRDAPLAIVIISNGNDTTSSSSTDWADAIRVAAGKEDLRSIGVYPIVSPNYVGDRSCLNSNAFAGTRYLNLAYSFATAAPWQYNVCNGGSMSTLLQTLASQLQAVKRPYKRTSMILTRAPILSTVHIFKNGAEIPANDAVNGWTFRGITTDEVCEVTEPYNEMCSGSGPQKWVFDLHGAGQASGADTLSITNSWQ